MLNTQQEQTEHHEPEAWLSAMKAQMKAEGKSDATMSKYIRDVRSYLKFVKEQARLEKLQFDQDMIMRYRKYLTSCYKPRSANSMIAGINYYFRLTGHVELQMRSFRIQRNTFRDDAEDLTKEDYQLLLRVAKTQKKERLMYIIQTLASTGIRISELKFITVEALRQKKAEVALKGKVRMVLLPDILCLRLSRYAADHGIVTGSVFVTRTGTPVDRSNVLHEMKKLGEIAGIEKSKVYPHNFRHLFAVTFYQSQKDVCHLADILGHSNINTTRNYTTTGQRMIRESIENLGLLED